jgi:hypothetical protein
MGRPAVNTPVDVPRLPAGRLGSRLPTPYPRFSERRPLTLAFVGQETYFDYCSLNQPTDAISPVFVDFRAGADPGPMLASLREHAPEVIVAFRAEVFPPGCFDELDAVTVGWLTEPLPRPGGPAHPDLERRLEYLSAIDPGNFDRIISFDPLIAETIDRFAPVWRSLPLPVSDEYFMPVPEQEELPVQALFTGRSTDHRELFLAHAKHEFDVIHLVHGVTGERLRRFLDETAIGINLHNEAYRTFENRCAVYLAAGNLLVTEPLSPTHGLEPHVDYLEVTMPDELHRVLFNATQQPGAYRRIRIRGRRKAEYFRASRVYPRLVSDLLLDVHTFGRGRRAG